MLCWLGATMLSLLQGAGFPLSLQEELGSLAPSSPSKAVTPCACAAAAQWGFHSGAGAMPRTAVEKSCKFRCLHCK